MSAPPAVSAAWFGVCLNNANTNPMQQQHNPALQQQPALQQHSLVQICNWLFKINERTIATAISSLANYIGTAFGFCFGLFIKSTDTSALIYLYVFHFTSNTSEVTRAYYCANSSVVVSYKVEYCLFLDIANLNAHVAPLVRLSSSPNTHPLRSIHKLTTFLDYI